MRIRTSSGLSMAYATQGGGRSIILLHPVGLRGAFWSPVMDELQSEFRLIAPDLRGHGASDASLEPFDLDDFADDVADLVRSVGQAPAVVVGCSMGGMVAQALAVRHPELLSGVVIANTGHRRNDQGRATMEQRARDAEKGMPGVLSTTLSRWFDADIQLTRPELVVLARDWLLANDPIVHAWSWRAIRGLDYADQLAGLKLPALAIAGLHDQSTPVASMKEMAGALPDCGYVEMDTGHLSPLEQPKAFASHLRDFVNKIDASA
ncbi:MAG: hydrolase [Hyphomicrobiales bacterium]|nr:hydrolase [Hyphomicrobiales bacterium]